jgi:RNA polymerase sigma-70 factor (ECF subfamily)
MKRTDIQREIIPDEEIIEMYWQREEKAIEHTDEKYGKFLFRIAYNILGDRSDCEECKNDTYLGVWNAVPPTRPVVFPAFITRIMRRIAINLYKKKTSQKRVPSELTVSMEELQNSLHSGEYVDREYEAADLGKLIGDYVKELSDKEQYMFVGRYYMAESVQSIAKELGITVSAVYKALDKIKIGLKGYLERNGVYI